MPYCSVSPNYRVDSKVAERASSSDANENSNEAVRIFYQLYGHGSTKVLLIIGLAATHEAWGPQLKGLCGTVIPNGIGERCERGLLNGSSGRCEREMLNDIGKDCERVKKEGDESDSSGGITIDEHLTRLSENDRKSLYTVEKQTMLTGVEACAFDNRGIGKSSVPTRTSQYSTKIMAEDALALMDHLRWSKAHVCGHSMGGMIACKLAAMAPHRVSSLALIGVTGGGFQCFPKVNRTTLSVAYRLMRAKTIEQRAHVDLDAHFTSDYLDAAVGMERRRSVLFKEYVKNMTTGGMQPQIGLQGQMHACWHHTLTAKDYLAIRSAGVLVAVIHGREDIIAQIEHARRLAKKLHPVARMVELPGGHLLTHQNTSEVNEVLVDLVRAETLNMQCSDWKNGINMLHNDDLPERRRTSPVGFKKRIRKKLCCYVVEGGLQPRDEPARFAASLDS